MSYADLERRIQVLEDIEAIKCLKARHYRAVDTQDVELFASVFTDDAVWESEPYGRVEGIEGLRALAAAGPARLTFSVHYVTNAAITVDGDQAVGDWYGLVASTLAATGQAAWGAAIVHEEYARVDGSWKIRRFSQVPQFWTPFDTGWAEQRFVQSVYGWVERR
ncbi:MAG: nuclear transport factor 2 family protein [Solirubrobacteraceae bacterium]|nr:nuclear transport factor 2 family protein [Solirubrobacteraceae bacterium]